MGDIMKITIVANKSGEGFKSGDRLAVLDIVLSKIDATKFTEWRTLIIAEVLRRYDIVLTNANIELLKFRPTDDVTLTAVVINSDAQTIETQPETAFVNFRITDATDTIEDKLAKKIQEETKKTVATKEKEETSTIGEPPKLLNAVPSDPFSQAMKAANFSLDFIMAQSQALLAIKPTFDVPTLPILTKRHIKDRQIEEAYRALSYDITHKHSKTQLKFSDIPIEKRNNILDAMQKLLKAVTRTHTKPKKCSLVVGLTSDPLNRKTESDTMMLALAEILMANKPINNLDIHGEFSLSDAISFANALRQNNTVEYIRISGTHNLDNEGVAIIADALRQHKSVTSFSIDCASGFVGRAKEEIGDLAAKALGDTLSINKTLKKLSLEYCKVTELGAEYLARGLEKNPASSLTILSLDYNPIKPSDSNEVGTALLIKQTSQPSGNMFFRTPVPQANNQVVPAASTVSVLTAPAITVQFNNVKSAFSKVDKTSNGAVAEAPSPTSTPPTPETPAPDIASTSSVNGASPVSVVAQPVEAQPCSTPAIPPFRFYKTGEIVVASRHDFVKGIRNK